MDEHGARLVPAGSLQPPGGGEQIVAERSDERRRKRRLLAASPRRDEHGDLVERNDLYNIETLYFVAVSGKLIPTEEPLGPDVLCARRLGQGDYEVSGKEVVAPFAIDRIRIN